MLDFVWRCANGRVRALVERMAERDKYIRVFEVSVGDLGGLVDYSAIRAELSPEKRVGVADRLSRLFLDAIIKQISDLSTEETTYADNDARTQCQNLRANKVPLVVVDFPIRGVLGKRNFPAEIPDPGAEVYVGACWPRWKA